jgi:hypothetical protein
MRDRDIRDFNPLGDTDMNKSIKSLRKAYNWADRFGVVPLPVSAVVDPILAFTEPIRAILRASRGAHADELRV